MKISLKQNPYRLREMQSEAGLTESVFYGCSSESIAPAYVKGVTTEFL